MGATRRRFRDGLKRAARRLFMVGDRVGIHAMPANYYSPVSSRRWMRANEPRWRRPSSLRGIDWNLDEQTAWVAGLGDYVPEVPSRVICARSRSVGGFRYGLIEAQLLHCFVRRHAPRRIVEIGSGSTTQVMADAARMNVNEGVHQTEITAIDPYAHPAVSRLPGVEVRTTDASDIAPADLRLEADDLLFIDSTHTVRTGSEVPHLYLDLVPSLPPGVWIHIHDIYLPFLYSSDVYDSYYDWQETTLVAALLVNNRALDVKTCLSALHHYRTSSLQAIFPDYRPKEMSEGIARSARGHFPASLWLRTADDPRPTPQSPK